jgi:hypothetical protein
MDRRYESIGDRKAIWDHREWVRQRIRLRCIKCNSLVRRARNAPRSFMTSENPFKPVAEAPESESAARPTVVSKPREPQAWQPLTFGGVARFARAHIGRIYLMQILFAVISGGVCIWFFATAWAPVVEEAIRQLPDQGALNQGVLEWKGHSPVRLAGSAHVSVSVDLDASIPDAEVGDWVFVFSRKEILASSIFGVFAAPYPGDWTFPANRPAIEPWWGAHKPFILSGTGLAMALGLLACWTIMSLVYAPVVRLGAFILDRKLSLSGAWRMAMMALMPGSLWVCASIILYQMRLLEFIGFLAAYILHFIVGWVYVTGALYNLPSLISSTEANPFDAHPSPSSEQNL